METSKIDIHDSYSGFDLKILSALKYHFFKRPLKIISTSFNQTNKIVMQKISLSIILLIWVSIYSQSQTVFSSKLPIVIIDTDGQEILDEPKITVNMKIIYNGPGNINHLNDTIYHFNGNIGIELRGNMSQQSHAPAYGFKTRDDYGENMNVSLLGMPSEHVWILYGSPMDPTYIRNELTYHLSTQMGHYASRTRYCELFINNEYVGLYALMEKIKRDKNRVDISKLTSDDTSGDDVTGGYIIELGDYESDWISTVIDTRFQYVYPKKKNIVVEQQDYIKEYVDSFQTALINSNSLSDYEKYIDVNSFIDFFIIQELSFNPDAYIGSVFFHKDKNSKGGKIRMGPVWDFDLAWGIYPMDSFQYEIEGRLFWFKVLLKDTVFENMLKCRWEYLREDILKTTEIYSHIDSVSNIINQSAYYNNSQSIDQLKTWINDRIEWLDENMPGKCITIPDSIDNEVENIKVYPNPVSDYAIISFNFKEPTIITIKVYDLMGKEVKQVSDNQLFSGENTISFDVRGLSPGMYFMYIQTNRFINSLKLSVIKIIIN